MNGTEHDSIDMCISVARQIPSERSVTVVILNSVKKTFTAYSNLRRY